MALLIRKSDTQLQSDVLQELRWDSRVKPTDIGVAVEGGVVTLTGTVGSWAARLAAQDAAHRVPGVLDVANDIRVKLVGGAERSDSDVAHAVRRTLEWDVLVPDERIRTTVSGGIVSLEGTVDSWSQSDDAVRAIRNLAGVVEVRNFISVEPAPVAPDALRRAIDTAIQRHAKHVGNRVNIVVDDGRVILAGEVESAGERNAIIGAVTGTPGVRSIENHLRVDY